MNLEDIRREIMAFVVIHAKVGFDHYSSIDVLFEYHRAVVPFC